MDGRSVKSLSSIGFISVSNSSQHGLFGGYLVLAPTGRPLEFHCTEPVKPSRAQEILYGPTLESYLYGEQLGQALLASAKQKPPVILTENPAMVAVREFASVPIILIKTARSASTAADGTVADSKASQEKPSQEKFNQENSEQDGSYPLEAATDCPADLIAQVRTLGCQLDLAEPFDRIHEAIGEAQRGSQRRSAA